MLNSQQGKEPEEKALWFYRKENQTIISQLLGCLLWFDTYLDIFIGYYSNNDTYSNYEKPVRIKQQMALMIVIFLLYVQKFYFYVFNEYIIYIFL